MKIGISVKGTKYSTTGPNGIGVALAFELGRTVRNQVVGDGEVVVEGEFSVREITTIRSLGVRARIIAV